MFQLVVGEIGRDWKEALYLMSYCELLLIVRGYRRRNILQYQLQRLQAYHSLFSMRKNEEGKLPHEIWPLYFDSYVDSDIEKVDISDEEIEQMQGDMDAYKEYLEKKQQP